MTAPIVDYVFRCEVLDVHDADTYKLRIDVGFGVATTQWIRLRGVNAPELATQPGRDARAFAILALAAGPVTVRTEKNRLGTDVRSFVRYVADVWIDGILFADIVSGEAAGEGACEAVGNEARG